MRRFALVLLSVLLTVTTFAQEQGNLSPLAAKIRLGRAMILQPAQPLSDADRAELARNGIQVRHALGGGRLLARVKEGAKLADARIASIEPMMARHKIHPSARRAAAYGKKVHIIFQQDVTFEDARAAVLAAGGALEKPFATKLDLSDRLTVAVAPAALDALASDERVLGVLGSRNWKTTTDNVTSGETSRVHLVHAAPYGLTGAGVAVSLFELAQGQADHVEFPNGRFTVNAAGGSSGDKAHATHVAGTIAAAGVNPQAKGMAPNAKIYQFCVEGPSNECEDIGDYGWLTLKDEQLAPLNIVADNNSWGYVLGWGSENNIPVWNFLGDYFGAYELVVTSPIDRISNERNVLFVHSAGNEGNKQNFNGNEWSRHRHVFVDCETENCGTKEEGDTDTSKMYCYSKDLTGKDCISTCTGGCETVKHDPRTPFDTIGVTASAKNVITVGALVAEGTSRDITGFSSRGPARDGRVKPDVVARGFGTRSPVPVNQYASMNGTSQASPVVTGIAALLVEQWRKTANNATVTPTPAQLKALIIAGANDLGNPGPDYTYGFGLVDAKNSVDLIIADGGTGERIRSFDFPNGRGQSFETTMTLAEAQNVRVVLNWSDPSIPWAGGDFVAEKALVNDIDLKIIDPAGNTHLPWKLDPVQNEANAVRGVNDVDNIEVVEIANATPGVYRIIATSSNVAEGPQKAVIVSNAKLGLAAAPCRDPQELASSNNDTPQSATQNLVPNAIVFGALCSATDLDYFNFTATEAGPVSVTVTAKDTPVRATLTGNNVNVTIDVPANTSRTLNGVANAVPATYVLKLEAAGAAGFDSTYSFTTSFGQTGFNKRRSTGRR